MSKRKGQSTLEYAIIIAVVVGGLMIMQHYVKRGYQGRLKSASDDMGQQFDPGNFSGNITTEQSARVSQVVSQRVTTTTQLADQTSNRTGRETQGAWNASQGTPYGQ
jgi:hypothetical protein